MVLGINYVVSMEMLWIFVFFFFCVYFVYFLLFELLIGVRMEIIENEVKIVIFNFIEIDRLVKIIVRSLDIFIFSVIEGFCYNIINGEFGNFFVYICGEFLGCVEVYVFVNKFFKGM